MARAFSISFSSAFRSALACSSGERGLVSSAAASAGGCSSVVGFGVDKCMYVCVCVCVCVYVYVSDESIWKMEIRKILPSLPHIFL